MKLNSSRVQEFDRRRSGYIPVLVEETEAHVLVLGLLLLFLLFFGLLGRGGVTATSCSDRGSCTSRGGGADAGTDVGEEGFDVDALQSFGEQAWPVRLDRDVRGLQDGGYLVALKRIQATSNIATAIVASALSSTKHILEK